MAFGEPYDPATPADTDFARDGDDRIRELKRALTERLSQVIEGWPDTDPLKLKIASMDTDLSNVATITADVEDNKPNPAVETFFYETDTDKLYVNEAGAWVEVASDVITPVPDAIAARVYKSVNQEIPDNVDTLVTWTDEDYDHGGLADLVTNNGRLTAPAGETGLYHLDAMVTLDPLTAGADGGIFQRLRAEVSGIEVARNDKVVFVQNGALRSSSISLSVDVKLVETQYVRIFIRHDRTATGVMALGQMSRSWFSLRKVGETP